MGVAALPRCTHQPSLPLVRGTWDSRQEWPALVPGEEMEALADGRAAGGRASVTGLGSLVQRLHWALPAGERSRGRGEK